MPVLHGDLIILLTGFRAEELPDESHPNDQSISNSSTHRAGLRTEMSLKS